VLLSQELYSEGNQHVACCQSLKFTSDGVILLLCQANRARWEKLPCNHYIYLHYICIQYKR